MQGAEPQGGADLQRELLETGQHLAAFIVAVAASGEGLPTELHLTSASMAVSSCSSLGTVLALSPQDRFRLASAGGELLRTAPLLHSTAGHEPQLAGHLVFAVSSVVTSMLQPGLQPKGAAAFAATTGKPDAMLPWLAAAAEALSTVRPADNVLLEFCFLAWHVLNVPTYAKHAAALADQPALQRPVAALLLRHCLPAAAGAAAATPAELLDITKEVALWRLQLCCLLSSHSLRQGVAAWMQQPGAGTAVLHAVTVHQALPASRPAGVPPANFCHVHQMATAQLYVLCGQLAAAQQAETEGGTGASGSSTSGEAASSPEQVAAAWQLVRALPHSATLVASLAAESDCPQSIFAAVYSSLAGSLALLAHLPTQPEQAEAEAWVAAADAALRLLPLLAALRSGGQRARRPRLRACWRGACENTCSSTLRCRPTSSWRLAARCKQRDRHLRRLPACGASCGGCTAPRAAWCTGRRRATPTRLRRPAAAVCTRATGGGIRLCLPTSTAAPWTTCHPTTTLKSPSMPGRARRCLRRIGGRCRRRQPPRRLRARRRRTTPGARRRPGHSSAP
ncbi:hypothetical protein ABPG75_003126 [Micractinium tetrahymenae]